MKKIGLALGGGGARGLSHIGVLRVLEDGKIPIHCISGTSMGAIIGAIYAVEPDVKTLEAKVREGLSSSIFAKIKVDFLKDNESEEKRNLFKRAQNLVKSGYLVIVENTQFSFLGIEKLEELINMLLPDIDILNTIIPFSCVATDLTNGKEKVFTEGPLRKCVLASATIPGVFPPVGMDNIYYNDGGAVNVTPIRIARDLGADFVIASNVKSKVMRWKKPEKAGEIITRSNYITGMILCEIHLKEADVVISPGVGHLHWTEFNKIDMMIKKGEAAAFRKLAEIKEKTGRKSITDKILSLFHVKK